MYCYYSTSSAGSGSGFSAAGSSGGSARTLCSEGKRVGGAAAPIKEVQCQSPSMRSHSASVPATPPPSASELRRQQMSNPGFTTHRAPLDERRVDAGRCEEEENLNQQREREEGRFCSEGGYPDAYSLLALPGPGSIRSIGYDLDKWRLAKGKKDPLGTRMCSSARRVAKRWSRSAQKTA